QEQFNALHACAAKEETGETEEYELQFRPRDPHAPLLPASVRLLVVQDKGSAGRMHYVVRPAQTFIEQLLHTPEPLVKFERSSEGQMVTNAEGIILTVNAAFTRITGYSAEEVIGRNPRLLQSGLHDAAFYRDLWREVAESGGWQGQVFNRKKSGEVFGEWIKISATHDRNGHLLGYNAVFYDLTMVSPKIVRKLSRTLPAGVYRTQAADTGMGDLSG
ncbi:MAG: PAS domain-containing protein, partial [Rhodoferax sp.]